MRLNIVIGITLNLGLVGLSFTQEYSCDYIADKEKLLLGKPNCGDNQCRCEDQIARCVGNRTIQVVPKLESDIEELYIQCYGLAILNRRSFFNIENLDLRKLHLLRNEVSNISRDIFEKFEQLTFVDISDNAKINTTLLYTALGSLPKRLNLNLTFNNIGISNVTDAFFQNLNKSNVVYLSLAENRIKTINLTVFRQLPYLRELHLNKNWINGSTGNDQLKSLHTLDLSQNELQAKAINFCLPDGNSLFPNMKILRLSNNLFSKLDNKSISSWNCLNNLEVLNLGNNTMKTLYVSFFSNLKSLTELNVGSNWMQHVEAGEYPPKLRKIDFRNNQFVAFPPYLCAPNNSSVFRNIKELNFSRNYIQRIITNNWACLPNITVLDFSKNDVREFRNNTFVNFTSLKELYLDNMIPWVKVIEPAAFNSSSLQNLSLRFDWIDFRNKEVHGIFEFCPNVKRIDISYNYFMDVDDTTIVEILSPMKDLETLKAQRISRKKFPAPFLTSFKKLRYLDLNRNTLNTIQFDSSFSDPGLNLSIRYISLAEGDINSIDQSAFPTSIMNALDELDVSDNEFSCNCQMQWFRDQIKSGKIGKIKLLKWPDEYVCRSPTSLVGTPFKDYVPDEECWHIKPITVAFIAIGSTLFVFTVLSLTAYYNRWYIQYYWYRLSRRRREARSKEPEEQPILDEIQYDCYVVYNSADDEFVHHPFRKLMENKFNYKLHIWKRDAANGALVDVILDAMFASKNIVVIVSNNLMKDQWCKFQVDVALHRSVELGRKCVLLVVLDDIDFTVISKSWCVLLTKTPKAYWSDVEDECDIKRSFFELTVKQHLSKPLLSNSNGCANANRR